MNWYKFAQLIQQEKQRLLELADQNYLLAIPEGCNLERKENGKWVVYMEVPGDLGQNRTLLVDDEPNPIAAVKLAIIRKILLRGI